MSIVTVPLLVMRRCAAYRRGAADDPSPRAGSPAARTRESRARPRARAFTPAPELRPRLRAAPPLDEEASLATRGVEGMQHPPQGRRDVGYGPAADVGWMTADSPSHRRR